MLVDPAVDAADGFVRHRTLIGRDNGHEVRTPYDDCVLIMPSRRLARGQTAVRLGRYVDLIGPLSILLVVTVTPDGINGMAHMLETALARRRHGSGPPSAVEGESS